MREDEPEVPETEERPEAEPTSIDDGGSTKPGEGPLDKPAEGEGTHRGW
jgi:hypothetical protein